MAIFLNFKIIFIKFYKELNNFLLLHCSSSLRDHSKEKGRRDFVMKRYGEGEGVSSDTVMERIFYVSLIFSFHVRKSYMSNVNFCNLSRNWHFLLALIICRIYTVNISDGYLKATSMKQYGVYPNVCFMLEL